jgi:PST family polysaccharide transporter
VPDPGASEASRRSLGVRVFQNTAAILGGRVVGLVFSSGTSVLLARFLGRERLGEYGAIYAYLALYGFFATFCLEQILAREVSIRRDQAAQLFYTGTVAALGFSLLGAVLAPLFAPQFGYPGQLRWLIMIAAIDLLVLPPIKLPGIIFQVDMRLWYSAAIGIFRQALWLLAVILLAFRSAAFYQVIVARTLCGIAEAVIILWTIRRLRLIQGPRRFFPEEARFMLRASFPLVLSTLAVGIYHRIDQVMLHKMSGDQVLGPYVIAVQLTELLSTLPIALLSSLFPALSQSSSDPERFDRYLRESYRLLMLFVFAVCAVVTPVATPFVELFYGKQFLATGPLLIVLVWSEVPVFFGATISTAMVAKGVQRWLPVSTMIGAVCNVLLNLLLIPRYGALGASWASVISYSLAGIFLLLLFSDTRPLALPGIRVAIPPLLLVLGLTMVLRQVAWLPWVKFSVSFICYSVGVMAMKTLLRSDFQRVWTMVRSRFA